MGTSFAESLRDLRQGGSAQAAAITRGASGPPPRAVSVVHGLDRLRCASLLKPLYCWAAAAHVADQGFWRHHAEPAVITSSNSDTRALWMAVGPRVILAELRRRCGVSWRPANGDPSRFGSVEVAAAEVADAYAALSQSALAGDPVAADVLSWMREVPADQAFGVRDVLRVPEAAIKCGWYGGADESWLRTHAVVVIPRGGVGVTVVVGMTAQLYTDERQREIYHARVAEGLPVEAEHERVGGPLLRGLMTRALAETGA
ncbi:hypothetical protein [Nonomuraea recticatena]|uniref:Beta-lactamase family protein n=1 Tax=Nonomuraea recticatena TaxID=46178 RepID=A0ABP6F7F9_9ACTN